MKYPKILVVEDENIVAIDIEKKLKRFGFSVVGKCRSATQAIEAARKKKPDLILMDVKLAGTMDGIRAAEKIREHQNLPIVYLTAYADQKTLERIKVTEPFGYIIKPFEDQELFKTIDMALYKHKMEENLRIQERTLHFTLQSIGEAVVTIDKTEKIRLFNPVAEELCGRTARFAVGKPFGSIIKFEDQRIYGRLSGSSKETGIFSGSTRLIRKPGAKIPIEFRVTPLQDDSGVTGTVLIFRDISERTALEDMWQKYEFIVNTSREFMTLINRDYVYEAINDSYCRAHGKKRQELIGNTVSHVWGKKAFNSIIKKSLDRCFKGEETHYQASFEFGKLGLRHFDVGYYPYFDSKNKVTHAVVISHDISDFKTYEEALIDSESRFRDIFENSEDVICLHDLSGKLVSFNPALEKMLGRGRKLLKKKSVQDFIPKEDHAEFQTYLSRIKREGSARGTLRLKTADGSIRILEYNNTLKKEGVQNPIVRAIGRDVTDQRLAEKTLRENKQMLDEAQQIALVGSWSWDLISNQITWSDQMYRISEADPKTFELTIENILSQVHPEDQPRIKQSISDTLEKGVPRAIEYRIQCPGGAEKIVLGQGRFVYDQNKKPIRLVGTIQDITKRRRTQDALRRSEEKFRKLFEEDLSGNYVSKPDGTILSCNLSFARIFGFESVEEALNTSSFSIYPSKQDRLRYLALLTKKKKLENYEQEFIRRDGRPITVIENAIGKFNSDGVLIQLQGYVFDITDRKKAEQQLQEQAALLDKANDSIGVLDLDSRIIFWNKSAEKLYGWTAEEAVGKSVNDLLGRQAYSENYGLQKGLIQDGEWIGELEQIAKNGARITVESRWTLVRDNHGKPRSILFINTDITERKKLQMQFLRAQRMESIGTLASGIAHDLNNVLSPILIAVDYLRSSVKEPRAQEMLSLLGNNVKRGADMIKQVLVFASGAEGERAEIQVKHVIKEVEKITAETFPKSISIETDYPQHLPHILGDATQIHQVLLNLCVNSRDAMSNGGRLTIRAGTQTVSESQARTNHGLTAGQYVVVSVTDTGTGIPSEITDRIFEPFFTTKAVGKGTGLGLSTAMAIIESHNGTIDVVTESGKGTQFRVYLPAVQVEEPIAHHWDQTRDLPNGSGELILVVDDEVSIRDITKETLEVYGYKVLTANDGSEAIAYYVKHQDQIKVVLTDLIMPFMDGETTIRSLKKINPAVKIIVMSGLAETERVEQVESLGIEQFLTKPYTAEKLLESLKNTIQQ